MTVKEQLMLISKGYTREEINAMKEAEKLEKEEPEKKEESEKKEEPEKKEGPEKKEEPEKKDDPRDDKIKEMEEEIKRLQTENVNRDNSGNNKTDTRSLFEQGVDIFKGKF